MKLLMSKENKSYVALMVWILALIFIGSMIGFLTKIEVNTWYTTLNRSPLTPPGYVFGIAWTILYAIIATCGWVIWHEQSGPKLMLIKSLYIAQLILNWSWTPLFFSYHLIWLSLVCLFIMDILVMGIMYLSYTRMKAASLLMTPYLIWLLFATYLNLYIWVAA